MNLKAVYTVPDAQRDLWRYSDEELVTLLRLDREDYARCVARDPSDPFIEIFRSRIDGVQGEIERRQHLAAQFEGDPYGPRKVEDADEAYRQLMRRADELRSIYPIDRFLVDMFGSELKPAGRGRWKTRCVLPGHEDRTPSMHVYADGRVWCFGCNAGGSIFDLTQSYFGLGSFREAVNRLSELSGMVPLKLFPPTLSHKGLGNREQSKIAYTPFRVQGGRVTR